MPRPKPATDVPVTAAPTRPALPKGWQWVRFGDVAHNLKVTESNPRAAGLERYVGLEHLEPRDLRIRSWGNIADGTTFNRVFRAGQVLFGKRRAYQRKAAVADFDGICSGDIYVFAANESRLIPELLPFIVQTEGFATHAESTSEGSLSPRTKWKYLAAYELALPSEPAEQRRIAELLRAADDTVEAWREAARGLETLAESLMLERIGRYFTGTRQQGVLMALAKRYEVQLGKRLAPETKNNGNPYQYLRNANIDWFHIDLSDLLTMCFTEAEHEKFRLLPGDILACEGRHTGKSALWRGERHDMVYQMSLHRLRRLHADDPPEYLLYHMRYFHLTGAFATDTLTTTIPHLSAERLSQMMFAFPPSSAQHSIVRDIESVMASALDVRGRIRHANELQTQLLAHLLTLPTE